MTNAEVKTKRRKKKRGRATKLDARMLRRICALLARGHTIKTVCEAAGIGERTFYDWKGSHPHFSQETTRAIGKSKIALVEKLRLSKDWRAQAFLLERRWPDEFGKSAERPLQSEPEQPSAPVILNINFRDDEETRKAVAEFGEPDEEIQRSREERCRLTRVLLPGATDEHTPD